MKSDKLTIKRRLLFSIVLGIISYLIVIQFRSNHVSEVRDGRDMWEIRSQLQTEQDRQYSLQNEIKELNSIKTQYLTTSEQEQIDALHDSIQLLEEKAGLTDLEVPGINIQLNPDSQLAHDENAIATLTPELLSRLINELNAFGAEAIAIGNERIINISAIRYVGNKIYVNQRPLASLPLEIKVKSANPNRMLNYLEVSQSRDEFAMHHILFDLTVQDHVEIPAFDGEINLDYVTISDDEKEGE